MLLNRVQKAYACEATLRGSSRLLTGVTDTQRASGLVPGLSVYLLPLLDAMLSLSEFELLKRGELYFSVESLSIQ